jgi:hypothetical protein
MKNKKCSDLEQRIRYGLRAQELWFGSWQEKSLAIANVQCGSGATEPRIR